MDGAPWHLALDDCFPKIPHESASDLYRLEFIDKRKMQKYHALCLEPVQDYDAMKVKALSLPVRH